MLEGSRPTDTGTGEGAWPGAPAEQYAAPAGAQKEIVRHILEFYTSENSKIGDKRYTRNGCSVLRCSLKDDVTTNAGLRRAGRCSQTWMLTVDLHAMHWRAPVATY